MENKDYEFKFESLQDTNSIVKYLNALKNGFSNGKIILGNKEKTFVLEPNGLLNFEVKAKQKKGNIKISLNCSWMVEEKKKKEKEDTLIIESAKDSR